MNSMNKLGLFIIALLFVACTSQASSNPAQDQAPAASSAIPTIPSTTASLVPSIEESQDPNLFTILPDDSPYRLFSGELQIASTPEDIPAIFANDALFVSAKDGDAEWDDEEGVIGVFLNGTARAYPIRLLSLHEVVNDNVGGRPIAVTWCPLCYTALVFDRVVDGRELTFGASGYLFKNNLVLYDHQTETLWSQLLAQGIRGAYSRNFLKLIAANQSTWAAWKQAHPDTRILSAIQMGKSSEEIIDPYVAYYFSGIPGIMAQENLDDRLPPKELVLGLRVDREKRAYTFEQIRSLGLINDTLGDLPILLLYNPALNSASAFSREFADRTLTFTLSAKGELFDIESASQWDIELGRAISGPLSGRQLSRLTGPLVFWFAWSDIYSETSVYLPDG